MEQDKIKKKKKKKGLKVYQFRSVDPEPSQDSFVLARSKKEAWKILDKEGYGFCTVTCRKIIKKPGIIHSTGFDA